MYENEFEQPFENNDVLRRLAERAQDDIEFSPRSMLGLPPTRVIEERIEMARLDTSIWEQGRAEKVSRLSRQLEKCRARDTLQALRPDGCFCLGVAERHIAKGWCDCPESRAARVEAEALQIVEREQERQERIARMWAGAGIPKRFHLCRLDTEPNNLDANPGLYEKLAHPAEGASWYFHGPVGFGKTGIAVALARQILELSPWPPSLLFVTVPALLQEIKQTYSARDNGPSEGDVIRKYATVPLALIDDLGAEQETRRDVENSWTTDRLYQIIGERHDEERPTIFTSNLPLGEVTDRIGERLAWRIIEMCESRERIIELKGRNLRQGLL